MIKRILLLTLAIVLLASAPASALTPVQGGTWQKLPPVPTNFNAVHAVTSPTGKVLLIAGSGRHIDDFRAGTFRSYIFDPRVKPFVWRPVNTPADLFCAGHVLLPDGRALVVGGTSRYKPNFGGTRTLYAFNFVKEQYERLTDMEYARWYPLVINMANGKTVMASGYDENHNLVGHNEVFDFRTNQHSVLPGERLFPSYPNSHLAFTGEIFYTGAAFSKTGALPPGFWNPFTNSYRPTRPIQAPNDRRFAASCFIGDVRNQQLMVMGGSGRRVTDVFDLDSSDPNPKPGPLLPTGKSYLNCLNLPDGSSVEIGGGTSNSIAAASREVSAITNPAGPFQPRNPLPAGEHRVYHSLMCLLDTGQVLSTTSNPGDPNPNTESRSVLLYSPTYLFKGTRPVINTFPHQVSYGGTYSIKVSQPVSFVAVTTYSSVTHSTDPNQRYLRLPVVNGRVTIPGSRAIMPPGWYRIWAVNARNATSVAWPIHIA